MVEVTHGEGATLLAGHVEEQRVFAGDDVGHAVPVVRHGPEPAAGAHTLGILLQVQQVCLSCCK